MSPSVGSYSILFRALRLTVGSLYLLTSLEWLFFVTKPSIFTSLGLISRVEVLWVTPLVLCLPILLLQLALAAPLLFIPHDAAVRWTRRAAMVVPALVLTCVVMLLIDNFTYTVFGYGVISSKGLSRAAYGILWTSLAAFIYYRLTARGPMERVANEASGWNRFALLLLALSLVAMAGQYIATDDERYGLPSTPPGDHPNILIISADGVDATHLGVYGYSRDTTPTMSAAAQHFAIFDNAFSNSATTGGSIASLMTGKLPSTTRLIQPPDLLKAGHSFQHLPAILRQAGYTLGEFGNSYSLLEGKNLVDGFHSANLRPSSAPPLWEYAPQRFKAAFLSDLLFIDQVRKRIEWRVLHSFGMAKMPDAFGEATTEHAADEHLAANRLNKLLEFIEEAPRPYFAHIHLMITHGEKFPRIIRKYSVGQQQTDRWMDDFYDDAILAVDSAVGQMLALLQSRGELGNTIFIVTSDHGKAWGSDARVPLLVYLPKDPIRGRYPQNVSRIDVAPTLLEYLGIAVPDWMDGKSLFGAPRDPLDPIFSTVTKDMKPHDGLWVAHDRSPPFFSLGQISMVVCNRFYSLYLETGEFTFFDVEGHTKPCAESELPDPKQAVGILLDHLRQKGYDVAGVPEMKIIQQGPDDLRIGVR
jgi:arylsulfatase A-like enzyme